MTSVSSIARRRIPRVPDRPFSFILYVLRHCSRRVKWQMVFGCAFEGTAAAADMLVAWSLGRIVGVILNAGDQLWSLLFYEMFILAGLWSLRNAGYRAREYVERRYVTPMLNTTRELLFNRLIQQSQMFLHANFAGVLANHVRRAGDIINNLRGRLQQNIVPLVVRFVTAGILLWQITPLYVLFILSFVVLGIVAAIRKAHVWSDISVREAEASSRLTGYIVDSTTNISLVKQNVGWEEEKRRLDSVHGEIEDAYVGRLAYASKYWGTFDLVMTFFFCGFMLLLAYGWQHGQVSASQLAMTVGIVTNLFGAIAGTVILMNATFDEVGILRDSLQKISTPLSVYDVPDAGTLEVAKGEVEFRDVTFGYSQRENLFQNLTLKISAGQKVGLVGISGAGKTTLCQLLLRSYDVSGGAIYIDGQDISKVTQDSLHESIAVIPQDPTLFHRTLAENIGYGKRNATPVEVREAAKAASIASFIDSLPQGYDTLVGERGIRLSGGQRQRIAIARAIVKNAPLLVLDEATSALDSETESLIQEAMAHAMKGRTTLVIAHRLSTLSRMDRIIVMENARIVEDGSFADLLARQGAFARLWNMQAGGFLPSDQPKAA